MEQAEEEQESPLMTAELYIGPYCEKIQDLNTYRRTVLLAAEHRSTKCKIICRIVFMILKRYMAVENVTAQMWQQKVLNSENPVVVNFSAARCGFCMALEPLYSRLSEQYLGKLDFLKLMVDDPQNNEVLLHASVEGTPTLKFYCRAREVGEHVGYSIEPVLKQKIDSMLAEIDSCLNNSTPLGKAGQEKQ